MKVLLRNGETGPYYAGQGEWTPERSLAMDFMLMERAIELNDAQHLGASHVVLAYDSPPWNLSLPLANYIALYGRCDAPGDVGISDRAGR